MTDDPGAGKEPVHDDEALALDFAIGGLDRTAMQQAQLRFHRDPAFRAKVERWQTLLAPLAETVISEPPPSDLWDRIFAETAVIAPVPSFSPAAPNPGIWSSVGVWRGWAIASTALAGLGLLLLNRPHPAVAPWLLVATLASPTGGALLTATYDVTRGSVTLIPADKPPADGRRPQLWIIEGDAAPRSLGTIDIKTLGSYAIPPERLRAIKEGSTLAISLEPKGGSKTGAPSGPIVAKGKLTSIQQTN